MFLRLMSGVSRCNWQAHLASLLQGPYNQHEHHSLLWNGAIWRVYWQLRVDECFQCIKAHVKASVWIIFNGLSLLLLFSELFSYPNDWLKLPMYIVEFKCVCLHMDGRDIYNILGGQTCPYQYLRENLEEATAAQCAPVIFTCKMFGLLCGISTLTSVFVCTVSVKIKMSSMASMVSVAASWYVSVIQ